MEESKKMHEPDKKPTTNDKDRQYGGDAVDKPMIHDGQSATIGLLKGRPLATHRLVKKLLLLLLLFVTKALTGGDQSRWFKRAVKDKQVRVAWVECDEHL